MDKVVEYYKYLFNLIEQKRLEQKKYRGKMKKKVTLDTDLLDFVCLPEMQIGDQRPARFFWMIIKDVYNLYSNKIKRPIRTFRDWFEHRNVYDENGALVISYRNVGPKTGEYVNKVLKKYGANFKIHAI